ncbi:DCC1 protein, partial [Amia calva]|nr:DCC1 protein [Amia calva]
MRTLEEVQGTLQIAKLKEEDLHPVVHCLTFSESVSSGDYCLMELDETLCKHIEAGKSLVIRGDKDEHAVLCSEDKTYDLKIADTSNLLLFIPDCTTSGLLPQDTGKKLIQAQISGFSNSYWELRRCRPKLKKLKKLLMENPYEGPLADQEAGGTKYSTEDLLCVIQASEEELLAQLQNIHACKIDGCWKILDFEYEIQILGHITQLVDSESWSFSKVPLSVCLEELGPLEPNVSFALNEDKVCQAMAQMLLQNAVKFNLTEFQEVWQQSVPEGMTTRLDQLKSMALVDRASRPETISLLRVEDLPEDTQERFNCLFAMREKWTEADIAPYIQDLCGEKQSTGALLTKYARTSMQSGVKVYNSRRPVAT